MASMTDLDHSSESNERTSPFLKLPAEIRLQIYEYLLGGLLLQINTPNTYDN